MTDIKGSVPTITIPLLEYNKLKRKHQETERIVKLFVKRSILQLAERLRNHSTTICRDELADFLEKNYEAFGRDALRELDKAS